MEAPGGGRNKKKGGQVRSSNAIGAIVFLSPLFSLGPLYARRWIGFSVAGIDWGKKSGVFSAPQFCLTIVIFPFFPFFFFFLFASFRESISM